MLGAIGAVRSLRRRHALGTGMTVATALTLAIYSYAGERFAWLLVTTLIGLACSPASASRRCGAGGASSLCS